MSASNLETDSVESSNNARQLAMEIVEESLTKAFTQVSEKDYKFKCISMSNDALKKALEDILNVYEAEAIQRPHAYYWCLDADKPAKLTASDILLKDFIKSWEESHEIGDQSLKTATKFMQHFVEDGRGLWDVMGWEEDLHLHLNKLSSKFIFGQKQ